MQSPFYGQDCHEAHLKGKKSVCQRFKKCPECCKVYKVTPKKKHACLVVKCRNCRQLQEVNHECYIQPYVSKDKEISEENEELLEDEDDGEEKEELPPPLICAMDLECYTDENQFFKPIRAGWSYVGEDRYYEADTVKEFLEDVFSRTIVCEDVKRQVFVYTHNMREFDGMFIQEELYDQGLSIEKILNQGAKALSFECGNVIFRDSLNFFNMPLEKLPATFNLQEFHKGFFAYSFIKPENLDYVGPYPPMEEYHPERMNTKRRKEFLSWYKDKMDSGAIFEFQKELSAYLKSDVFVLKHALETFQEEMIALTGVDPLTECVTIASTAFRVWQKNFLEPDLIALEPLNGWRKNQVNQSLEALEWLEYENVKIGGGIRHVRNSLNGEVRVITPAQSFFVDGFHAATNTIYEYMGCFFHGCKTCFPDKRNKRRNCHPDRTIEEIYEATLKKTAILRHAGYTVVEKWGREYAEQKKTDLQLQEFLTRFELVAPLEPREAFFGERTGAATLYAHAEPGEEILYQDFTSLYPAINKYGTYPVGFPEIHLNPADQNIYNWFGIAKVDILPPEHLFHPVLPVRQGGKLTFPLCSKCVEEEMKKPMLERSNMCGHTLQERRLRGTWCTPELQKAVDKGYQILKIHEVFHFSPEKRRTGLFSSYVNTWLKLKQESAGWPKDCQTSEQKAQYIREYEEREEITLENVEENPGRKAIARMLLNR